MHATHISCDSKNRIQNTWQNNCNIDNYITEHKYLALMICGTGIRIWMTDYKSVRMNANSVAGIPILFKFYSAKSQTGCLKADQSPVILITQFRMCSEFFLYHCLVCHK